MSYIDPHTNQSPTPSVPSWTKFPSNPDPGDAYLHATLERIDQLANEDVEMQVPLLQELTVLVLDTNILLHYFDVIQQFTADIEVSSLPVLVIIPGAVIFELDGQKNRDGLAWFARRASSWLLKKVKERRVVKGQAHEETCKLSGNWKVRVPGEDFGSERANDYLIFDCVLYHRRRGRRAFLCSNDNNLCTECESANVPSILPSNRWSSQELAYSLFGHEVDLRKFAVFTATYKDPKSGKAKVTPVHDDDDMEIDDAAASVVVLLPSHALDSLHMQIIEHFTSLLLELIGRVGGPEVPRTAITLGGATQSLHAPAWSRKPYLQWSAPDCLEYLSTKKELPPTSPRLDLFLTMPYAGRGARRGQDWSRMDWKIALDALATIGGLWQEISIQESLIHLRPHLECVFASPMSPTGIGVF